MQTPLRQFDSDTRLMGFVDKQIRTVVLAEQRSLERFTNMKITLLHQIEDGHHGYKTTQDAWQMIRYYDARIEECKTKIAEWLQLFK